MFITEISGRCNITQGVLQPFICQLDDGSYYFAKGSNSTVRGLIGEWIAANLAQLFDLPTPTCAIAYLDPALKAVVNPDWYGDLELEYLFASKSVAPCETLTRSDLTYIPDTLQRDIYVFDYWIKNNDRHLGEVAGNVNLLFQPGGRSLQVIDFNLAFEGNFDAADMKTHVFRPALERHPLDLDDRSRYSDRFDRCLASLDKFIGAIPDEWIDYSPSSRTFLEEIRKTLTRYNKDCFWGALS